MLAPWRTGMPDRPAAPLDRPFRDGRVRKRWRWIGAFSDELMLCAAVARIGPARLSWWAVWDREQQTLTELTRRRAHTVQLSADTVAVSDGLVRMDLRVQHSGTPVETISPHGGASHIWTCKTPVTVTGEVRVGERRFAVAAPGLIDDSGGYHARHTDWRWSAGVGTASGGAAVVWNLVAGLHDAPGASERTVWVDGEPHQLPPLGFADDLSRVGDLRFRAEATRVHRENLLVAATDYEQPFGTFTGELPVAGAITGYGVMERHSVRW
jgi:hypothetical protein